MSKSDLGSWAMEQCMLDIARKISFASPKGGPEAEFTVPLSFSPTRSVSWWDQARAETEVQDKLQELGECADKAGIAAPDEVWITLYIGTRGQVQSAGFASATPLADEWATCAADKATAWVLSDPRGRVAKMTFRYAPE
jgi:hypothetical protein